MTDDRLSRAALVERARILRIMETLRETIIAFNIEQDGRAAYIENAIAQAIYMIQNPDPDE